MKMEKSYQLRNGLVIPWISFGTGVIWRYTRNPKLFVKTELLWVLRSVRHLRPNRELKGNLCINRILQDAYDVGYRMFDTGRIYAHSERKIGKTVMKYPDAMVTTKCSAMDVTRKASPNNVAGNLQVSLGYLNRPSTDLYLLHWPEGEWLTYYADIIGEYRQGNCKAFGACNMELKHLQEIEDAGLELPMVIQTELHPLYPRHDVRKYCEEHGIQLMAHSPTAHHRPELYNTELMNLLTTKYQKKKVQIVLRWQYQHNIIPVVSTFNKKHMEENLDIFDFSLTDEDMLALDHINDGKEPVVFIKTQGIDDPNYIYNL